MVDSKNGKTLEKYVNEKTRSKKRYDVLRDIYARVASGEIVLIDPSPPRDFFEFLLRIDYSLWFWSIIGLVVLAIVAIVLSAIAYWILYLRFLVGAIIVLFLPGYVTIRAIYVEKNLKPIEELALSIGVSLALVPLIGLVLNFTPLGLRLEAVFSSLVLYILVVSIIAIYREYRVVLKPRSLVL